MWIIKAVSSLGVRRFVGNKAGGVLVWSLQIEVGEFAHVECLWDRHQSSIHVFLAKNNCTPCSKGLEFEIQSCPRHFQSFNPFKISNATKRRFCGRGGLLRRTHTSR
jgi:hypothetical protein